MAVADVAASFVFKRQWQRGQTEEGSYISIIPGLIMAPTLRVRGFCVCARASKCRRRDHFMALRMPGRVTKGGRGSAGKGKGMERGEGEDRGEEKEGKERK